MKKSVNSRMTYARENNQFAAFSPKDSNNNNVKSLFAPPPPRQIETKQEWPEEPRTPSPELPRCICQRKSQIIECKKCKMLCYGRVSEPCPQHPNVTYLLDLYYCPSCICSRIYLKAKASS